MTRCDHHYLSEGFLALPTCSSKVPTCLANKRFAICPFAYANTILHMNSTICRSRMNQTLARDQEEDRRDVTKKTRMRRLITFTEEEDLNTVSQINRTRLQKGFDRTTRCYHYSSLSKSNSSSKALVIPLDLHLQNPERKFQFHAFELPQNVVRLY